MNIDYEPKLATPSRRRVQLALLIAILVTVEGGYLWRGASAPPKTQSYALGWDDYGYIILRPLGEGRDGLLLRYVGRDADLSPDPYNPNIKPVIPFTKPTYLYRPGVERLEAVSGPDAWANAKGDETNSWEPDNARHGDLIEDLDTETLRFKGERVKTKGHRVLRTSVSPCGRFVAVVSTSGLPRPSLVNPLLGQPASWGKRYHEVFERKTGQAVGGPTQLANADGKFIFPCWSGDAQYVVYTDWEMRFVWIVNVGKCTGTCNAHRK